MSERFPVRGRPDARRHVHAFTTGTPAQPAGGLPAEPVTPVDEIVAVPELERMAERVLPPARFAAIRGGARGSFDRMTFRQRLMVYAMDLDLTTELFGHAMFAPIIVGPVGGQGDLHPEGELATARGSAAAQTIMVAARGAGHPVERIVAATDQPVWYQVYAAAAPELGPVREDVARAVDAGCRAICLTVGVSSAGVPARIDWDGVEGVCRLARDAGVPVVVKGVMRRDDARQAVARGAAGVVVSNHGGVAGVRGVLPIDVLPAVADDIGDRVPVLVDGGFVRGSDVLKGLALGATAVLVARPVMWGLAAYGAAGVETALRLLITELARNMAASGRPTIDMIDRALVRIDSR